MYTHEIEPIIFLSSWLVELDLSVTEGPKKTLVPDVAHAIQGQLCISLLYEHRLDLNVIGFRGSSVIVH